MKREQREELLMAQRVFPLFGRIENNFITDMQKAYFEMCLNDQKSPVQLVIDSGGGSVGPALNAYDLIKGMPFETEATVIGVCNSAALIILSACKKRKATKMSRFLFHAMRTEDILFSTEDIDRQLLEMKRRQEIVFNQGLKVQSEAFGIEIEELKKMMFDGERYGVKITAEEAKEKGVVHEIIEKFDFLELTNSK